MTKPLQMVCRNCGMLSLSNPKRPGSTFLEVVLWVCFLFPGILYSIWRSSQRKNRCAACGNADLVPAESPMGQKLVRDMAKPAA